ncbi:MAG: hypothetical protein AAFX05_12185 [Planctomycetota bacterium]
MTLHQRHLPRWVAHLRHLASPIADREPLDPATFRDDMGHRRAVDAPFISWRLQLAGVTHSQPEVGIDPIPDPDVALWLALAQGDDPTPIFNAHEDAHGTPTDGLFARVDTALEIWTETELSALHALWWHAHLQTAPDLDVRLDRAVRAYLEELQPDNATNHPWALHVFLLHAWEHDVPEADMYAQTLLSNSQVMMGKPDRFSAVILLDVADALERSSQAL